MSISDQNIILRAYWMKKARGKFLSVFSQFHPWCDNIYCEVQNVIYMKIRIWSSDIHNLDIEWDLPYTFTIWCDLCCSKLSRRRSSPRVLLCCWPLHCVEDHRELHVEEQDYWTLAVAAEAGISRREKRKQALRRFLWAAQTRNFKKLRQPWGTLGNL